MWFIYHPLVISIFILITYLQRLASLTCLNSKFLICVDYNVSSLTWTSNKIGMRCSNFFSSYLGSIIIEGISILDFTQFNGLANSVVTR